MTLRARVKRELHRLRQLAPGTRFQTFHHEQRHHGVAMRIVFLLLAVVSFAIGVVLAFIPGPAVVFFALTGALLATQSNGVAKLMDRGEVTGRRWFDKIRDWWRRHRSGERAARHSNQ